MEHRHDDTAPELPQRVREFQEARFGMFIHWGLYAIPGKGEWVQFHQSIPADEYAQYADRFDPVGFDAAEWVALAKAAGQKYLVVTTKHHDGFCMWDTALTDYNIVGATPFGRDPIAELAAECERQGITFGVYYSVKDWHHPDYPIRYTRRDKRHPDGFHGRSMPDADFMNYLDYMQAGLRELLTGYGAVGAVWFDWYGDAFADEREHERAQEIADMIRELQPGAVVNDRLGMRIGADFVTSEQEIPDGALHRPFEVCMTVGDGWGYNPDEPVKSGPELILNLVDVAGKGGNYLLNVGPSPEGTIREAEAQALREVGRWLEVNGESVYGTTGGPSMRWEANLGAITRGRGREYLHVTDWPEDGRVFHPDFRKRLKRAYLLGDPEHTELAVDVHERALTIHVPSEAPDPVDSVIAVEHEPV